MKDVRNTIAHVYIEDNLTGVFSEVLFYTVKLITIIETTLKYMIKELNEK